jgi:phosphoenolpyruvate carboxykinase (ATP)
VQEAKLSELLETTMTGHSCVLLNQPREALTDDAVKHREVLVSANGALATWTPPDSTGRSPKDTLIVRRPESEDTIDWDSPNNLPLPPETFDMILEDVFRVLPSKDRLYISDRVVGADSQYAMPVRLVTDRALTTLFADNMFRPVPPDIDQSVFYGRPFQLFALPYDKLDEQRYEGRLRLDDATGRTSRMVVVADMDRRLGVVFGSSYCGSVKKLMFTVLNYLLPHEGVLPLHCSANEGPKGDTALLLGLSGTGKTTLSADPERALLGDDEHGWSKDGVWNFENGCYAKLINLDATKEPEIHHAVMHDANYLQHGTIVENALMYPDGTFDLDDERLTPNSRASYPLTSLSNIKASSAGGHPSTILFLTADANGVLPPVARLTPEQARLWFLMGYTSKLAGTERGVVDPVTVFSRFFGQPFMPCNPPVYSRMLGEKLATHGTSVYLVNTGWSGGPYGEGHRIDIALTRAMVQAALSGELAQVSCDPDPIFRVLVPRHCPGLEDQSLLQARETWQDKGAYDRRARKLAGEFAAHFEKAYGGKGIDPAVAAECPGR